jgi:hypothetical protein
MTAAKHEARAQHEHSTQTCEATDSKLSAGVG